MELRQLTYFEAVARHGGFTRAAEHLHVAQSAVSAQIRLLEAELGAELFARTTRRVALTEAGELLLHRVRRAFGELDGVRSELADLAAVLTGRVTLGATAVLGGFDLPSALAGFHRRYPGVTLSLRSGLIADLLTRLDDGTADLVVGPLHADLPSRFSAHPIAHESVVLIAPPGHRLALTRAIIPPRRRRPGTPHGRPTDLAQNPRADTTRGRPIDPTQADTTRARPIDPTRADTTRGRPIDLAEASDESFVCLPAGSGLRAILDEAAGAAGFTARVPFESHSPGSIRELVAAGLGVALLARTAAETPGPAVAVVPLTKAPPHPAIGVIHHRERRLSPATRACRHHLIEIAASHPPTT
ncbi:LysR family transcriptional regulator [Paractinoplanes atraurantiacus]|uniref:DNA-binding transcriptional regulator, LysR family n=1 Tax=Paractinoplanes atraurantiacus TaxID=1036182 RepID=A0A285HH33_9ACTN|nr:LysR family transcriptional regulator [Actinoplanes atraurantiacus]SNY34987.1 DNA-binding transcriptional regulator, LysR family [Actinoplanes atraurantiacus]